MFNALVDTRLSVQLGEPDDAERARISAQLSEALQSTVGEILGDRLLDVETVDRVAPWARDLARGLHWQALHGGSESIMDASSMLDELAETVLDPALRREGAEAVATAWALTYDRIVDQIHGHQAHKRLPSHVLLQRAPWQDSVSLGYGIHLMLEWLRLDPRVPHRSP